MANDLISRSALIAEYDRVHIGEPGKARKLMEEAPAVNAVEVVRCKGCIHYEVNKPGYGICADLAVFRKDDDFCSYGERKDND